LRPSLHAIVQYRTSFVLLSNLLSATELLSVVALKRTAQGIGKRLSNPLPAEPRQLSRQPHSFRIFDTE